MFYMGVPLSLLSPKLGYACLVYFIYFCLKTLNKKLSEWKNVMKPTSRGAPKILTDRLTQDFLKGVIFFVVSSRL